MALGLEVEKVNTAAKMRNLSSQERGLQARRDARVADTSKIIAEDVDLLRGSPWFSSD